MFTLKIANLQPHFTMELEFKNNCIFFLDYKLEQRKIYSKTHTSNLHIPLSVRINGKRNRSLDFV